MTVYIYKYMKSTNWNIIANVDVEVFSSRLKNLSDKDTVFSSWVCVIWTGVIIVYDRMYFRY